MSEVLEELEDEAALVDEADDVKIDCEIDKSQFRAVMGYKLEYMIQMNIGTYGLH